MTSRAGRIAAMTFALAALLIVVAAAAVRSPWVPDGFQAIEAPSVVDGEAYAPDPDGGDSFLESLGIEPGSGGSAWVDVGWLAGLLGVVALAGLALIVVPVVRRFRRIGVVAADTAEAGLGALDGIGGVETLRRGIAAAHVWLQDSTNPDDAVIAAWRELEFAAHDAGMERGPSQTPAEFTIAVLAETQADPDATRELLELYHRARFSSHPVTAADVDRAAECLTRIGASWPALAEAAAT